MRLQNQPAAETRADWRAGVGDGDEWLGSWSGVWLERGASGSSAEIKSDDHIVADEIVRFAWENDAEILAVDGEVRFDGGGFIGDLDAGGESDALGHAMQGEVARHLGFSIGAGRFHGSDGEGGLRELGHIEEIRAFEMAGQPVLIGP